MSVPWWAYSPSPMTLGFYSALALYGAYLLGSKTKREWISNFAESAFLVGLIILPFDMFWQTCQWFKYSYLFPNEWGMVIGVLIRDATILSLCLLSSWKLTQKTGLLKLGNMWLVAFPMLSLLIRFYFTFDPGWTDWTYPLRYASSVPWLLSYLSGLPDRAMLGLAYLALWKWNFING